MKIKFLARSLQGSNATLMESGRKLFHKLLLPFNESDENPDVLIFLTGGTEELAIPSLRNGAILCPIGTANGLAAALEVRAYAHNQGFTTTLVHDIESSAPTQNLWRALSRLESLRVGRIGAPSDWLIKSGSAKLLEELGVSIVDIATSAIETNLPVDPALRQRMFQTARTERVSDESLELALGVDAGLKRILCEHNLDAFTLRCFDLVAQKKVSACLSLAILNSDGMVAACEGDMEALATMLLAKELVGKPSFMANLARFQNGVATFAHCTANLQLVPGFAFDTHFESNASVAIRGQIEAPAFTVFRAASGRHFSVYEGKAIAQTLQEEMCRTQLSMELPDSFVQNALGNHQVIIPGRLAKTLSTLSLLGWTQV